MTFLRLRRQNVVAMLGSLCDKLTQKGKDPPISFSSVNHRDTNQRGSEFIFKDNSNGLKQNISTQTINITSIFYQ